MAGYLGVPRQRRTAGAKALIRSMTIYSTARRPACRKSERGKEQQEMG